MPKISEVFTNQQIANAIFNTKTLKEAAELLGFPATHHVLSNWKKRNKLIDYMNIPVSPIQKIPFIHNNHSQCTIPGMYKLVLCIPDIHAPYHHPDTLVFLTAVKEKYFNLFSPEEVLTIQIGDEGDWHFMNYHEHNVDLLSGGDEVNELRNFMHKLQKLFPVMYLLESNHGSLYYRKALTHGFSKKLLLTYRELLDVKDTWTWYPNMVVCTGEGKYVEFHHGRTTNVETASRDISRSLVQGHFHEKFCIHYWGTPIALNFGMSIGCLIDDNSSAFQYNRQSARRPKLGCGIIINGVPQLIPMELGMDGRWIGKL